MRQCQVIFADDSDARYVSLVKDLAGCLSRREVVPLLGAGISHESPSRLPVANQLVLPLIDVLWRSGEFAFRDLRPSLLDTKRLEAVLHQARLERLLDALCQTHGERALDYLSPLASRIWNPNHAAIARLAKEGLLSWCITLNFDLLLEEAMLAHGLGFRITCPLVGREFVSATRAPSLTIVKPHGSFAPHESQYRQYELLSATLSQIGSRPSRRNTQAFTQALAEHPVVLVAGYSDDDWDIFPILARLSGVIGRVIWVEFGNEDQVRRRANPLNSNEPCHALRNRVFPWLCESGPSSCLVIGRCRNVLADILGELGIAESPCPMHSAQVAMPDASRFNADRGPTDISALRTMASLGLLVQQVSRFSERLLEWLLDHARVAGEPALQATLEDALGHTRHTYGNLEAAIRHTKRALSLKRENGPREETAGMVVWLGYEYLCVAKRPHPAKVWRLLGWAYFLIKGLWLLRKGVGLAAPMERPRQIALAAYYRADLLHSWGSLFMLLGPGWARACRPIFRIVTRIYDRIAGESELMDGEYYWLRHLEARLFAGAHVDRQDTEKMLNEIEHGYQLVQNNVQIGNVHAYRGLVAYVLGCGTHTERQQEAESWFRKAAQAWESAAEGVSSGSRRLCIFRRFAGLTGLSEAVRSFLKHS